MFVSRRIIHSPFCFQAAAASRSSGTFASAPIKSSWKSSNRKKCIGDSTQQIRLINIGFFSKGKQVTAPNVHLFRTTIHRAPSSSSGSRLVQFRTNFSFAGPRKLDDIIKVDLVKDKSTAEISDMWMTYHEGKEKVHGLILNGSRGKSLLSRAAQCPFFIHPVFRDEGHFMIVSQFQAPNYFLLAFLEDYQMDPARAQPLLTISVFDDLSDSKDLSLVRCDIINRGIEDDEGYKLCKCLIDDYSEDAEFESVHMFNKKPDSFDVDDFVKKKETRWNDVNDDEVEGVVVEATAEEKK